MFIQAVTFILIDIALVVHSKDLANWTVDGPAFQCSLLDRPMMIGYPAGLLEAKNDNELPGYIKDTPPKHTERILPFRLFQKAFMIGGAGLPDSKAIVGKTGCRT